jgi:phosphoglycolate phosphatase
MAPPLLVFDLDGTLVDTAPDLLATLDVVLPRHGYASAADASLRNGIGLGARYLIEYALELQRTSVDTPLLDAMYSDFLVHYEANICVGSQLYPGTAALLDRFAAAGWSFAVCTNKPERLSRLLLQELGVTERFAAICGGDSFSRRKPDPAHLLDTIEAASGARNSAVMVGDSETDIKTARAAAVPVIGVTFGYTPVPMEALGPDLLIDSFDALESARAEGLIGGRAKALSAAMP